MNRSIQLVCIALLAGFGLALVSCRSLPMVDRSRPLNVLFLGNSYTYYNALPTIFQEIVAGAGLPRPIVAMSAPGGCTLERHLRTPKSIELIEKGPPGGGRWDAIVLQEQSQVPAWAAEDPEMRRLFIGGADGVVRRIRACDADVPIIFYETWARAPSHWARQSKDVKGAGRDPVEMQQRVRAAYDEMAANALKRSVPGARGRVMIARVGDVWERNFAGRHPVTLHGGDGAHPGFAGSYLAGLVIAGNIYGDLSVRTRYDGKLPPADAAALRDLVVAQHRLVPCEVR